MTGVLLAVILLLLLALTAALVAWTGAANRADNLAREIEAGPAIEARRILHDAHQANTPAPIDDVDAFLNELFRGGQR